MGMSRDVEAKYCLLPCPMRPENTARTGNGRSGGQAVGVQERSGVVQKVVQGCVVEQGEQARRPSTLRCLLSNLRAPRFWPSDVVCGGGATGGSRPGEEGTSSTAAPPPALLLGVGLKILHRPNPFLPSEEHAPVVQSDSSTGRPGKRQGRTGCLSGLHSRSHLISSHLYSSVRVRSPPLHCQSWFRPGLVSEVLLHTNDLACDKVDVYLDYMHLCMCQGIYLWLAVTVSTVSGLPLPPHNSSHTSPDVPHPIW